MHARARAHTHTPTQVELIRRDYVANGGWETFLSYEDPVQDILIGAVYSLVHACTLFVPRVYLSPLCAEWGKEYAPHTRLEADRL